MKHTITCLLVFLAAINGKAQKIDSAAVARLSPEQKQQVNNYLWEAKKAKTAAMVLSIGGGAVGLAGACIAAAAATEDMVSFFSLDSWDNDPTTQPDDHSEQANVGGVMFLIGAASAIGSIPFFIKVHKKRNAARAIVFADKGVSLTPNIILPGTQSAQIGLVVSLGRKHGGK